MHVSTPRSRLLLYCVVAVCVGGCGGAADSDVDMRVNSTVDTSMDAATRDDWENASALPTSNDVGPPARDAGSRDVATETAARDLESPQVADESLESADGDDFQPPFAGRTNLFAPPNRTNRTATSANRPSRAVTLQGFVNVDGLRVVLDIDGEVAPIREGDEKFGVQVIAIQPPKVVLQRGRERWTEVLEN